MRNHLFKWPAAILTALGFAAVIASAQTQPADRAVVRNSIDMSVARSIRLPTAERIRNLERSVVTAPATELPAASDSLAPPIATPAEVVPTTEKGKLYHVDVTAADDRTIANLLASQQSIRSQGNVIVPLPGVYRQQATDGTELLLKPFVIPQKLAMDAATGRYVGSIKIGVNEIGGPAPSRDLSAPISFQVLNDDIAVPDELLVRRSGFPLSRIRIATFDAADGLTVTVASPFNPEGVPVLLMLAPSFTISINRSIEGFGLEATTITVSATGLAKPAGKLVRLTVDGPAKSELLTLRLDENGDASTELRSVGAGRAVVRASLAGFQPVQATVVLSMPYLTLAASTVGGLVGGLIRLLPAIVRRGSARRFFVGLAVSVLVGFLIFALYAVGVNLLPFAPTVRVGAILVFAVSAAGAYFGSALLGGAVKASEPQ